MARFSSIVNSRGKRRWLLFKHYQWLLLAKMALIQALLMVEVNVDGFGLGSDSKSILII